MTYAVENSSLARAVASAPATHVAAVKAPSLLARFGADKRGSTAIIFALLVTPAMMLTGMAVDYSKMVSARAAAQNAIDAAALAGARAATAPGVTDYQGTATTAGASFFNSTPIPNAVHKDTLGVSAAAGGTSFTFTGNVYVSTPFLSVIALLPGAARSTAGLPSECTTGGNTNGWICQKITVTATSAPKAGGYNIETALILDMSGSMGQSDGSGSTKLASVQKAAKDLASILVWADQSKYTSKIAIAPYSMGVNVGTYAVQARGPIASGTSTTPGSTNFTFTSSTNSRNSVTQAISNCVSERTGTHAFDDVAPSTAYVGLNYPDPANPCLTPTIMPLSNTLGATSSPAAGTINYAINQLSAGGSTAAQVGIAWGWYMLSPNFNYMWPAASHAEPYSDLTAINSAGNKTVKKIAIIMTDGEWNSPYCKGVISQDALSGSGNFDTHINCNAPNGDPYTQATTLCTNMKNQGIEIFTIGFLVVDSQAARNVLSNCATNSSHYFVATTGTALQDTFKQIAQTVNYMRLTQ